MQRSARADLWDVLSAANAILDFIAGLDLTIYAETDVIHSAVERKFEIIGEALSQLAKLDSSLAACVPDIREIIAFRNLLIHGYAAVEHHRVRRIAGESLPGLRARSSG